MPRLLIIDDERLARLTLRKILERAGHEVMEASTGNEGLAMFRAKPCDLVITDIIMPDKEGIETIIELKRDFPGVRVIAISHGLFRRGSSKRRWPKSTSMTAKP